MAIARGFEFKTALEPREKIMCAYLYLLRGISQHDLVCIYGVNQGRINGAIKEVARAVKWPTLDDIKEEGAPVGEQEAGTS